METGVTLDNEHWYDHVPNSVETSHEDKVTTLWNQWLRTDNKPDVIIREYTSYTRNMHVNP